MQNLNNINEYSFIGMNDKYPSHLLPKGVFQLVENALVVDNKIKKRPGTDNVANSLGSQSILGITPFEPTGASKRIIACRNGSSNAQLYSWDGSGSFAAIGSENLTKDLPMNFVQASNYVFGFNGAEVVDVDSSLTVTRNRATVPQGLVGMWFHNYLFVGGTSANPSRLYWSDLGDPTTFDTTNNFIDVNANDGDQIMGMGVINDELFVFKRNTIWSITGWSGATFDATTAAGQNTNSKLYGYGCVSHQSIVSTGRDIYYLSFIGGQPYIRSFRQTASAETLEQGVVSSDIETLLSGVNKSQLGKCSGIYDGKFIYWALPNGSSQSNDLVVVFDPEKVYRAPNLGTFRSWVKWTGITPSQYCVSTVSGRAKIYFGDATTGGFVFEQGSSAFEDSGTAISMDVRTRDYMLDPARKTKWKYMYVKFGAGQTGSLKVYARTNQSDDFTLQDTLSLEGSSPGLGEFVLGSSTLGGTGIDKERVTFSSLTATLLGVRFTETTNSDCEVYDYQIFGFPRGLREE